MVFNPEHLDWKSSVLKTRPILQLWIQKFYVQTLIICLTKLWDPTLFQDSQGSLQWLTSSKQDCLPTYDMDRSWPWDSQIYIKHCQLTKQQNQNFTLPDIKESVLLKSSLGTWRCHKLYNLSSVNFLYKISNGQDRKKEGKSEVQKFNNLEDKRIFFGKKSPSR